MNRRTFLSTAAAAAIPAGPVVAASYPIIDTHIHLFDPTRPQGIPWPDKKNTELYKPALPKRYREIAVPLGVKGAIEVEASPWLEDNQWVLDVIEKDPIMVGTIGNLEPGKPDFAKQLERFHRNPLFLGIRYGNLWGRDLSAELRKPEFISDVKRLSQAGLTLDTANPNPTLIESIVRLTDAVPELRVVIDHLPQLRVPAEPANVRKSYEEHLRTIGKRPQIYVKISEVFRRENGRIETGLSAYRGIIDELFGIFGEDRVLYGSDWPNSDNWKPYAEGLRLVQSYFSEKGSGVAEKYFWKNSVKAYRWKKRDASQPG